MGINDEVVATVGREVGVSVSDFIVQQCAIYLQPIAPDGMYEPSPTEDKLHTHADATHSTPFI